MESLYLFDLFLLICDYVLLVSPPQSACKNPNSSNSSIDVSIVLVHSFVQSPHSLHIISSPPSPIGDQRGILYTFFGFVFFGTIVVSLRIPWRLRSILIGLFSCIPDLNLPWLGFFRPTSAAVTAPDGWSVGGLSSPVPLFINESQSLLLSSSHI